MESRLRKLELAGFSSALIGNVCPKQGFRKVTSILSTSSSNRARWASPRPTSMLGAAREGGGVMLRIPEQEIQYTKTNSQGERQFCSLLISFPGSH